MATAPVVVTRTGTGWTVDVTAANLSPDLTLKDFIVFHGSPASLANNADYAKTSQTVLTYSGSSLALNTPVEVRRRTPETPIQIISYAQRFSSGDFNNEIDRITRRAEEYTLFGIGPGSILTTATPLDTPFGVSWNGNIVNPPTMNAVYDEMILKAPLASPAFTGVPTAPTASLATNNTQLATTAFVQGNLASYAPLASPTLTGTPTAPTASTTTDSTQIATTAHVKNWWASRCEVVLVKNGWTISDSFSYSTVTSITEKLDAAGNWASDTFTAPATGTYEIVVNLDISCTGGSGLSAMLTSVDVFVNGSTAHLIYQTYDEGVSTTESRGGRIILDLTSGNTLQFRQFVDIDGSGYTITIAKWNATIRRIDSPVT